MGRKPGKAFRNMERIGAFRNLETRGLSHSASTRIKRATRSERAHPATTPGTTLDLPHRRPFPPKPAHPVDHVDLWGWIDKCRGRADPRLRYSDVELLVRCIDPVFGEVSEISSAASSPTLDLPIIEIMPPSQLATAVAEFSESPRECLWTPEVTRESVLDEANTAISRMYKAPRNSQFIRPGRTSHRRGIGR